MDNVPRNTEAEQLAHSGDLGLEKPERDFDNTTLPEAFEKHLTDTGGNVIVPDNAAAVAPEKEAPKKRGKLYAIGAAALAGIAGVSLAVGLNLPKGDHDGTAPTPDDKATNQPSEAPSPTPEIKVPTIEQLEIPSGLDPEAVGKLIIEDRLSGWSNASAENDLLQYSIDKNESWDTLIPELAEKNAEVYGPALFGPDYKNGQYINQKDVDNFKLVNETTLKWYVATQWSHDQKPDNKEGYRQWMTVNSVEQLNDGNPNDDTRTILVNYTDHSNSDKNEGPAPQREGGQWTFELKNVGNHEIITAMSVK